ncbi:IS200/IS605 family element transposase accessory protein TnpB (plasmid) [Halolamina sp. CBA1230]|uniref:RNA-guided endonuclease InsQ/TnpB family protein n=1 Tax=Halolamina sp. CBA1230 TaxID=1853690 RepID=UPI0009A2062D|nr:RNA-guided endonuclease TnpB family protein [Halolamina sp. CBA1230]QKY22267.1 IS200/IS605 family element transposase accessory protein TnpB [Halolamina sp. CBA1230]
MVEETFKYAATPEDAETATAAWHDIQTCREVYNHALTQEYRPRPDYDKPSYTEMQNKLTGTTGWKQRWPEWKNAYSKCLQMAIRRIKQSERVLESLQTRGYNVGQLKWKPPREYRSITYNQSGFDVDHNTDRTGHAIVNFSKIGDFHLNYHRPLPEDGDITQIILKKEKTGDWSVSIVVEYDPQYPEKPCVEEINPTDTVGIDLGITKFIHDSAGRSFGSLDEQRDRDRIERRHRNLSRKAYGSNSWEKARQKLAQAYDQLQNRREDYREKLADEYTTRYDAVFLEDLDVKAMTEDDGNSRNIASMSWRQTIQAFKRHGKKNGCYVIEVPPEGTTKRCSQCGCETEKPLWVREHSCPSCGFETDRDYNAALEIKRLGLEKLGVEATMQTVGQGMAESTPAETALPGDTEETSDEVSPKRVVETGSPCLKEPPKAASRQG